jgi:methylphosphotriester-DNA--protein-cysteine methyltransferase
MTFSPLLGGGNFVDLGTELVAPGCSGVWRMALAKDELRRGTRSIGEIALAVTFLLSSAFSKAFTRIVGCSPKRFAARL